MVQKVLDRMTFYSKLESKLTREQKEEEVGEEDELR